jgi:hypothetical protein
VSRRKRLDEARKSLNQIEVDRMVRQSEERDKLRALLDEALEAMDHISPTDQNADTIREIARSIRSQLRRTET